MEKPEYSLAKNETLTFITPVPLEISPEIRQSVAVFGLNEGCHYSLLPLSGISPAPEARGDLFQRSLAAAVFKLL